MSFGHYQNHRDALYMSAQLEPGWRFYNAVQEVLEGMKKGRTNTFRDRDSHTLPDEESQREDRSASSGPQVQSTAASTDEQLCTAQMEKVAGKDVETTVITGDEQLSGQVTVSSVQNESLEKTKYWLFKSAKRDTPFTISGQLMYIIQGSLFMNIFMFFCPVGLVLRRTKGPSVSSFVVNFISTIPANCLGNLAMDEIGLRLGLLPADFLSISVGNMIQFMSCIVLLRKDETTVLQTSIIGSILANVLFFLGISILLGCYNRPHQDLNRTAAHMAANLLSLSSTSLLIPTASQLLQQASPENLVKQSRGVAIVLMVVYGSFLLCEQYTHRETFVQTPAVVASTKPFEHPVEVVKNLGYKILGREPRSRSTTPSPNIDKPASDTREPQLHLVTAILLLAGSSVLLYFHIEYAAESIDALTRDTHLSRTFVGLILFPLSNCDYVPILLAMKGRLGHTITQTAGKSIQTALWVTPLIIIIAWAMGKETVTLAFDGFEVISLFATVLLLNFLIVDSKLHWVQGILLLADWGLIAIAAYFAQRVQKTT